MIIERGIEERWLHLAVEEPDNKIFANDGTIHYIKTIDEAKSRILRVVTNPAVSPVKVITAFFDRRLRKRGIYHEVEMG